MKRIDKWRSYTAPALAEPQGLFHSRFLCDSLVFHMLPPPGGTLYMVSYFVHLLCHRWVCHENSFHTRNCTGWRIKKPDHYTLWVKKCGSKLTGSHGIKKNRATHPYTVLDKNTGGLVAEPYLASYADIQHLVKYFGFIGSPYSQLPCFFWTLAMNSRIAWLRQPYTTTSDW